MPKPKCPNKRSDEGPSALAAPRRERAAYPNRLRLTNFPQRYHGWIPTHHQGQFFDISNLFFHWFVPRLLEVPKPKKKKAAKEAIWSGKTLCPDHFWPVLQSNSELNLHQLMNHDDILWKFPNYFQYFNHPNECMPSCHTSKPPWPWGQQARGNATTEASSWCCKKNKNGWISKLSSPVNKRPKWFLPFFKENSMWWGFWRHTPTSSFHLQENLTKFQDRFVESRPLNSLESKVIPLRKF